jgi:hypothetical protein
MIPITIRRAVSAAIVLAFTVVALPTTDASAATSMKIYWSLPAGGNYNLGVDHVGGGAGGGYEQYFEYPNSVCNNNQKLPNPFTVSSPATLTEIRLEFYKGNYRCGVKDTTAGVAIRVKPAASINLGNVIFPTVGAAGSGRFQGRVLSHLPRDPNKPVTFSMFQQKGQPRTNTGVVLDAFTAGVIPTNTYATNALWNGTYIAFINDTATGRKVTGLITLSGNTTFDIDLDAVCFGIDECQWSGTTPLGKGDFHPVTPSRLVDTRTNVGIVGVVKPGDGRLSDPNDVNRTAARINHEFRVLGRGGIPTSGVSAVLANVTVTGAANGAVRLFAKPPRTSVFADQSSFPAANTQPGAAFFTGGDTRSSMQLLRVGVGGKIRVDVVSSGPVHLRVDVIGWFDSQQPGQSGSRVVPVVPARVVNSKTGVGVSAGAFVNAEQRAVQIRDGSHIPAAADLVLATLSSFSDTARGYDMLWPFGGARPVVQAINTAVGQTRSNLVAGAVSADGKWTLQHVVGTGQMIVDTAGYVTDAPGAGGVTQTLPPTRVLASVATGARTTRVIRVAGVAGVPTVAAGAKGVWLLVTASSAGTTGWASVYPSGIAWPGTTTVQWTRGLPTATLTLVPVGADGTVRLFAGASATIAVDLVGWVN